MNDMYHDGQTASPTYGIPGKRNGVVVNFPQLNEQQLTAMAMDLSLAMGKDGLIRCQKYFSMSKAGTRIPTIYEFDFLDLLVRLRHEKPDSICIGRTNAGHPHLSATREDFLQKLHALCPGLSTPISLSEAAEVASRYLDSIGVGYERPLASVSPSKAAAYPPLSANVALLLLQPNNDTVSVEEAMKECMKDATIVGKLLRRGCISSDGIALTFAKEAQGIHVNLAQISSSDPTCLLRDHVGTHWVAARQDAVLSLRSSFATHGLTAIFFAVTTNTGKLTLEQGEHPPLSLDLKLLSELSVINNPKDFQLSDTDERPAPFFECMYDALTLALLGCANGFSRTAQNPSTTYRFPSSVLSSKTYGLALEAILGAYRVWIELCISDTATVTFSEALKAPAWTIALTERPSLPNHRTQADSQIMVIPLSVGEDGMPDYTKYRAICDTLYEAACRGKILACREACKETIAALEDPSVVRALLLETAEALPLACAPQVDEEPFFEMKTEEPKVESK